MRKFARAMAEDNWWLLRPQPPSSKFDDITSRAVALIQFEPGMSYKLDFTLAE
ncbi:hypothetical protein [Ensifer sp. SSB1]|jgi:hypothetical protein|uniref:hypothetical protein n=1 Tax=Ensifer sp. SSB1 TaxID=2795385 RepID=UPI001A5F04B2|nr:hypothetical protein [Ensifer sp. SSB1]MBK5567851.1 hypothetical protein [Ensifer sp. SSB1]